MKKASSPRAYLAFPAVMSKFLEKGLVDFNAQNHTYVV